LKENEANDDKAKFRKKEEFKDENDQKVKDPEEWEKNFPWKSVAVIFN